MARGGYGSGKTYGLLRRVTSAVVFEHPHSPCRIFARAGFEKVVTEHVQNPCHVVDRGLR